MEKTTLVALKSKPINKDSSLFLSKNGRRLQSEEDEESNHQTEETHSFGEGESKNGVARIVQLGVVVEDRDLREELSLEGWVSGVTDDEGAEHSSDTSSGSSNTDGGGTSTDELGGGVNISGLGGDGKRSEMNDENL